MVHQHLVLIVIREYDHCGLNTLIDISLAIGRRKHDHARVAFPRKPIDAIVIVLVEHPEFVLFDKL